MQKRITIFDTVRGFTMISMAGFHACYDLAYLYDWDMPWFTQTVFQDIWRASISWVFLFIALSRVGCAPFRATISNVPPNTP